MNRQKIKDDLGSAVRAVVIRGVPREEARIDHNWFAHERPAGKLIGPWPLSAESRIVLENNAYGLRNPGGGHDDIKAKIMSAPEPGP